MKKVLSFLFGLALCAAVWADVSFPIAWTPLVTSSGNVTMTAPSTGSTLTLNGAPGGYTQVILASTTTGQSLGLQIRGGTNSSDAAVSVVNAANTQVLMGIFGDGHFQLGNNGTSPSVSSNAAGNVAFNSPFTLPVFTVGTLPTCNTGLKGSLAYVTDATAPTYNAALTGGGAVIVPVFCTGASWTSH